MGFLSGLFHSRDKPTNSTNGSAVQSDKSNSNTLAVVSFYLEELSVISDSGKCNGCVACAVLNILAYTVQVVCALHVRISVFAVRWQICYEFTDFSKDLVLSADSVYKTLSLRSGIWQRMCHIWKRGCLQGRSGCLQTVCLSSLQQM